MSYCKAGVLPSFLIATTIAAFSMLEPTHVASQPKANKIRLKGFVCNSRKTPLGGVDVSIWTTGKNGFVAGGRTNASGDYDFQADVKDPFDLSFKLTNYRTYIVSVLSEAKEVQLSKYLYRHGEPMPTASAHAYLQSLERIRFLATALKKENRGEFISYFGLESDKDLSNFKFDDGFAEGMHDEIKSRIRTEATDIRKLAK